MELSTITDGTITIYDYGYDAEIEAEGFGEPEPAPLVGAAIGQPTIYTYSGSGSLTVTGSDILFLAEGSDAHIDIAGRGDFVLKGTGWFTFETFGGIKIGPIRIDVYGGGPTE